MKNEYFVLIIAENGLALAAQFLFNKAKTLTAAAAVAANDIEAKKLESKAKKSQKLAEILKSADAGLKDYMQGAASEA